MCAQRRDRIFFVEICVRALSKGSCSVSFLYLKSFQLGWGVGCVVRMAWSRPVLLWGSASSVRYCVYRLYIMYINWDVSLCKLMVYSLQIKLSLPLHSSYWLEQFLPARWFFATNATWNWRKDQGLHGRGAMREGGPGFLSEYATSPRCPGPRVPIPVTLGLL